MGFDSKSLPYAMKQLIGELPPDKKPRAERGKGKVGTRKRERCAARVAASEGPREREVYIPAAAIGKPTMTHADKWKQRECVMAYRAWCDRVRAACPNPPPAEQVESCEIYAIYAMPASWSKRKRTRMVGEAKRSKPDGDNIAKAICDALWDNDHRLGDLFVRRRWGLQDETTIVLTLASASPAVDGDAAGAAPAASAPAAAAEGEEATR